MKYSSDAIVAEQQCIPCSGRRTSGQLVVYFFANPVAAVEHVTLNLYRAKTCCLSKRVTFCGSLARNVNNYNNDNRRDVNANNEWQNGSEMTLAKSADFDNHERSVVHDLAYNLGILFLFLLIFLL